MEIKAKDSYLTGFTVLIPFYNERNFLPRLLESLLQQTELPAKLVLIDNDSTDDSVEVAKKVLENSPVPYEILHEARKGKANALEQGCTRIETEYTVCTDADTWFPSHSLELAKKLFEENPDYSCYLAFGVNEEWAPDEQKDFINKSFALAAHFKDRCFSGGYGHFFRSDPFLRCGGFSTSIWPYTLMDHEIIHRMLKYGKRGYHKDLWCYTSFRRTNRRSVRWNFTERFLYHHLPPFCMGWFFYKFLSRRFEKRKIVGTNLREQPWQTEKKVDAPSDEFAVDKKYLTQSSLFSVLGTIFKVAAPILMIVVARVFDKEQFGIYVSVQLLMLMLSRVAVLGLDKGLHWFIPQNRLQGRPAYYGVSESVRSALLLALGIFAVGVVASFFGLHRYSTSLSGLSLTDNALFFSSLLPWVVIHVLSGASEGNRKPQYKIFVNDIAVATLAPLIALGLYACGFEKHALPIGLLSANIIGAVTLMGLAAKQFPNMPWFTKKSLDKVLFRYALPLGFSEVVISLLLRMDLWMVLLFLGPGYAGVYALMVTISNGLRTISLSYAPILLPVVAGMKPERYGKDLKGTYSYCVALVTLIQLSIGFFIVLFPDEILMIAGKSFVINPEVLGILLFGNLLNGFFGLSGTVINGMGNSRFMLKLNVVTLMFALCMNFILIPRMGLAGAALSTASYQLLQCVWMNVYLVRMGYWPYKLSLLVQVFWMVLLLVLYIAVNTNLHLSFYQDVLVFTVAIAGLLITLWRQGLMDSLFSKGKK